MSRPRRRGAAIAAPLRLLLMVGLLASGGCGGGPLGFGGVLEDGLQTLTDARRRAEIRELEKTGGPEATGRLLEIYKASASSHAPVRKEAIEAIGRLGRREDVPALLDASHWNEPGPGGAPAIPKGLPWFASALADIGGPEACAALTELLRDRLPPLGRREGLYYVDIHHLAAAIERAECLPQEELRSVLWTYGGDLGMARNAQEDALRFLAERGDAEAARRLAEYAAVREVRDTQHEALEAIVVRPDLPWWLRSSRMRDYVATALPRERLFDTYFGLLLMAYQAGAPDPLDRRGNFTDWAGTICRSSKAVWSGNPTRYFEEKRARFQADLSAPVFELLDRWLWYAKDLSLYEEERRERGLTYRPGSTREPGPPDWSPWGASTPSPEPAANLPLPAGVRTLRYEGGRVTLEAKGASLLAVLQAVSRASGVPIGPRAGVGGGVSVKVTAAPLEEALRQILRAEGEETYCLELVGGGAPGQPSRMELVRVLRQRSPTPPQAPPRPEVPPEVAERFRAQELEYRAVVEKMANEKRPLAAAIAKYRALGPNDKRRVEFNTFVFLNVAPWQDPRDKALLKAAIFDPENLGLLHELQRALVHEIAGRPEASDREYLLHLFARPDIGLGWLVQALPKVWDEGFVPYLLHDAAMGSGEAMRILGWQKVRAAVPVLEEMLLDQRGGVRQDAADALLRITGYEYGRY